MVIIQKTDHSASKIMEHSFSGVYKGKKYDVLAMSKKTKVEKGHKTYDFAGIVKVGETAFAVIGRQTVQKVPSIKNPQVLEKKVKNELFFCIPLINPAITDKKNGQQAVFNEFQSPRMNRNNFGARSNYSTSSKQEPRSSTRPSSKTSAQSPSSFQTNAPRLTGATSQQPSSKKTDATPQKEPSAAEKKAHRASQSDYTKEEARSALGVDKNASQKDISDAYKKLARQYHPDKNHNDPDAKAKFQEVKLSYEKLKS